MARNGGRRVTQTVAHREAAAYLESVGIAIRIGKSFPAAALDDHVVWSHFKRMFDAQTAVIVINPFCFN